MADNEAGPSNPKRARTSTKRLSNVPLSDKELERLLYESEEEFSELYGKLADSDQEFCEGEDGSSDDDAVAAAEDSDSDSDIQQQPQPPHIVPPPQAAMVAAVPPLTPKWSGNSTIKNVNFSKSREFLVVPDGNTPINYFNLLVDDNFFAMVAEKTNKYAEKIFLSLFTSPSSRITNWRDVTAEELRVFFGVLMHMGTIVTNRLQDYWKTSRLFNIPFFSASMSRDRFLLIMKCLHFARNPREGEPVPKDRLFKVRPIIDYFNNKMVEIYYPGKNLSLDESMVIWRGRLSFRQYIKNTRHKYGIKLYVLTEPDGIILKFAVYPGQLDDFDGKGHAANVVLHLLEERLDVGHSIYMDNYYNSHDLAVKLLDRQTHCTGTLRVDRKNTPAEVKFAKLKKGETVFRYSDDGVLVGKWRDKQDVAYITTEFTDEMVTYRDKLDREKEKPAPIYNYNKYMGGVDRQDQLLSYYPCERKPLRWYKKLGIHIFQMLLLNCYLLFKQRTKSKILIYDFRLSVIDSLVPPKPPVVLNPSVKDHAPKRNPLDSKRKAAISRRCTWCYNQHKRRRNTSYHCPACDGTPYLCVGDCFVNYHKRI